MKISYKLASGGSYTVLGDESSRSALLEDFKPAFQPQNQNEPLFRASNTFKAARGNMGASLAMVISVPYSTRAAAKAGARTLKAAFAAQVHLKVEEGADAEYYPNALLAGFVPVFAGVTVRYQLQFLTDDVTTTAT